MNELTIKSSQLIKIIVEINFYISVILLVAGGFLSVTDNYSLFQFNQELYGALDNNLRMVMVYLALSETFLVSYSFFTNKLQIMLVVGSFLVLMIGSLAFYAELNAIEVDPNFPLFFLYTGLSHIVFGVMVNIEKNHASTGHF
jgi:hypothetical protein